MVIKVMVLAIAANLRPFLAPGPEASMPRLQRAPIAITCIWCQRPLADPHPGHPRCYWAAPDMHVHPVHEHCLADIRRKIQAYRAAKARGLHPKKISRPPLHTR